MASQQPPAKRKRFSWDPDPDDDDHFIENLTNRQVDNLRISEIRALTHPQLMIEEFPCSTFLECVIKRGREAAAGCILGQDDRTIAVVGPCSVHDAKAALEYAQRLKVEAERLQEDVLVIMRVYLEKPRTTVGWKGLINDPYLDETFRVNDGFRIGRKLLRDVNSLGLPCACAFVDTLTPQYIADLVSWAEVDARTTECQTHRELSSGLSMPVGFKNTTSGDVQPAVDAVLASRHPHCFFGVTKHGTAAIVHSKGNDTTHVVLRGGKAGPNHHAASVADVLQKQAASSISTGIMIDCSHGNSGKDHRNQPKVLRDICEQIAQGAPICGVMIDSNLFEGRQDLPSSDVWRKAGISEHMGVDVLEHPEGGESQIISAGLLRYGVSITDACVDWASTVEMLEALAKATRERRVSKAK